ncbi:amidohydrolase [Bacillus sp. PK3_68]|nr:amidohydrolase [Bacillus sp. PK3_68]
MVQQKADVILSSDAVFTGLTDQPHPAAIAIIDNKIAAIGSKEDIKSFIGEHTQIHQYGDQLIMPGFHDFHLHIMMGGLALNSVNLFKARSEEETVQMVADYARKNPDDPWIIGFKWDAGRWDNNGLPSRSSLDQVISDRPILLFSLDSHYSWVNSKALEIANITRDTGDPSYGYIEKDIHGEPTGILVEKATELVADHAFDLSRTDKRNLLQHFLRHAASYGVTSVNNMYGANSKLDDFNIMKEFEENGELTARIHLFPVLDGSLEQAKQLRKHYASDKLRVSGLKQFIDGVVSNSTAYMIEPYSDDPTMCASPAFPPETIKEWVAAADKEGFSVRFHAIGDAAIRLALDAYEGAQKANGVRDSRHSIEHIEVIHPDDIPRFHKLGVMASMQPGLLANTERNLYVSRIGEQRSKKAFALHSLQEAGAKLALSTDFPIDPLNPMHQIHKAVTRIDSSGTNAWNAEERITLSDALKAYTHGSAYGTFREHELGTLEVGKLADIVVLDRNLFEVPEEEILNTEAILTVADGKVVFDKSKHAQEV